MNLKKFKNIFKKYIKLVVLTTHCMYNLKYLKIIFVNNINENT